MEREFSPSRGPVGDAAGWGWPLASAERVCCCPAWPVVTVVMPSAPPRALLAAGAAVCHQTGVAPMTHPMAQQTAGPLRLRRVPGSPILF
jgi:hypothetical protein